VIPPPESAGRGLRSTGGPGILWGLVFLFCLLGPLGCGGDGRETAEGSAPPTHVSVPQASEGSSPDEIGYPVFLEDAAGALLTFHEAPSRIVSLVPSATQILQALGAQDLLAGRTQYDTDAALAHLPSVGGGLDPSLEALVVLEPELVIRFAGESDTSTPARLDDLGIPHMAVRLDQVADVRAVLTQLGTVTGRWEAADELLARMDADLEEIREQVRGRAKPKVAYVLGGNPPWVAGPGTFIHELLTIAGGENVFSDLTVLYGPVSTEEFLVRPMDLLLAPEGSEVVLPERAPPVVRVSPSLELPGPALADAALELARILHPEVFR
jgi:iron complex transport system substrate-binding protein